MKGSLIIVCFFTLGVLCGICDWIPVEYLSSNLSFYALCGLMFCVGLSIGHNPQTIQNFRTLNPLLILLPIGTIIGTLSAALLIGLTFPHRTIPEWLAVSSGFGYYSLSSIFITEYKGAELGIVALLSNIVREIITLLCAPLMVRWFGNLAPIASGGATTRWC